MSKPRIWTRETTRLVDDEPVSPFVRTALSGDIACPLANSSDQGLHYINADYTMLIGRYPVGEWVGLEVTQQIDADGISMGSATLVDATGREVGIAAPDAAVVANGVNHEIDGVLIPVAL